MGTLWKGSFYHRRGRSRGESSTWRHRYSGRVVNGNRNTPLTILRKKAGLSRNIESTRKSSYGNDRTNPNIRRLQKIAQRESRSFKNLKSFGRR